MSEERKSDIINILKFNWPLKNGCIASFNKHNVWPHKNYQLRQKKNTNTYVRSMNSFFLIFRLQKWFVCEEIKQYQHISYSLALIFRFSVCNDEMSDQFIILCSHSRKKNALRTWKANPFISLCGYNLPSYNWNGFAARNAYAKIRKKTDSQPI